MACRLSKEYHEFRASKQLGIVLAQKGLNEMQQDQFDACSHSHDDKRSLASAAYVLTHKELKSYNSSNTACLSKCWFPLIKWLCRLKADNRKAASGRACIAKTVFN